MKKDLSISEIAKKLGRQGGNKVVEKYGKSYMKELSKLGVEARRKKKEKEE